MQLPSFVEHYVTRDDAGLGPVRSGHAVDAAQFVGFVEHHTVSVMRDYDRDGFLLGDVDDVRRYMQVLQVARPDLGGEVPYSWVIFPGSRDDTCIVAEGRGRGRTGAHTAGLNSTRYAWAIAGNTDTDRPVTPGMVAGMRWLAAVMLVDPEHAVAAIGHRHAPPYIDSKGQNLNATGCPGNQGVSVLPQLQPPYRLDASTISGAGPATPPPQEDDVKLTFKTAWHEGQKTLNLVRFEDGFPVAKQWIPNDIDWWNAVYFVGEHLDNWGATLDKLPWWQGDAPAWTKAPTVIDYAAIARAALDQVPPAQLPEVDLDAIATAVRDEFSARPLTAG